MNQVPGFGFQPVMTKKQQTCRGSASLTSRCFILSVTPQYLWTVQKISNSRIHGSNPIAVHGKVKAVDGGLQLNGVDAWLDAGDFYGQCLGDPDLCIKGFSFALQVEQ